VNDNLDGVCIRAPLHSLHNLKLRVVFVAGAAARLYGMLNALDGSGQNASDHDQLRSLNDRLIADRGSRPTVASEGDHQHQECRSENALHRRHYESELRFLDELLDGNQFRRMRST
jgi:hypothetical protein